MQREQAGWGRAIDGLEDCLRAPGQRVAGKAVDSSTRFVALVRGCECLKNSEVCRLILSPCFDDGCIAPLLKKQAYGAGESGEVKIQEPEFADSLARPAGAAKSGSDLRKEKASSPVITCVSSYLNHSVDNARCDGRARTGGFKPEPQGVSDRAKTRWTLFDVW